jgi:hypothetical protein
MFAKKRPETDTTERERDEESVEFSYTGTPPGPNPLDYRYMYITANRWADTGGCWSVVGILFAGGLCLLPVLLYIWILTR